MAGKANFAKIAHDSFTLFVQALDSVLQSRGSVDLGGLNATLIRSLALGPNETLFLFRSLHSLSVDVAWFVDVNVAGPGIFIKYSSTRHAKELSS